MNIRASLSILRPLFGIMSKLLWKRVSERIKSIFVVILVIPIIAVCSWGFAQQVNLPGLVNQNHPLLVAKPKYESMPASDVIEVFDTIPNDTATIFMNQEIQLKFRSTDPKPVLSCETGAGKSYLIPALEIPMFILALNGFDRLAYGNQEEDGKKVYSATLSTFWDHLVHGRWGYDKDAFDVNQFGHPYQGSIYHGFARSAGLNFWESLGYTFLGSLVWETGGETTHPSVNDQIASGVAGSFFGEVLVRMSSLLLESGGGKPGFWRELGAAALSPPTGFNRLVFGGRFKAVFPSRDPAIFQWVRLAEGLIVSDRTDSGVTHGNHQESLNYSMSYGLPGKPNYSYSRPFDYFQVEVTAITHSNVFENITTRGLLLGKKYEMGNSYRGIWGLYGSFDYISPRFFRVSSTAASLGTTAQWWLAPAVALQGTLLAGIGLGAGGKTSSEINRDYHYGATGRAVLALRFILSDVAMFDTTARAYYISSLGGSKPNGTEAISHLEAGLFFRIYDRHALGIQYTTLYRDGHYSGRANVYQSQGTLTLMYTFLGDTHFGAVEWRGGYSR